MEPWLAIGALVALFLIGALLVAEIVCRRIDARTPKRPAQD